MDKNQLLKEILANPEKFYNKQELKLLRLKLKRETKRGGMGSFVKKIQVYDDDRQYIFTDGSCINNGKKNSSGGYGIYFHNENKQERKSISKRMPGKVTNNKAELTAILECTKLLTPELKYYIVSDSEYSINCVTKWCRGWEKNNWKTSKGTAVLNRELIEPIVEMLKVLNVKFLHVNSHLPRPDDKTSMEYLLWYGNKKADELAEG